MKKLKRIAFIVLAIFVFMNMTTINALNDGNDEYNQYDAVTVTAIMGKTDVFNLKAKSAVLMDGGTGTVLYESNPHQKLPIASVTKIMTMLLVMEAVDSG